MNGEKKQCGLTTTKLALKAFKRGRRRRNGIPLGAIHEKHELKAFVIPPKAPHAL